MKPLKTPNQADPTSLSRRADELRSELSDQDPWIMAAFTGSNYRSTEKGQGVFHLEVWGNETHLTYPEFIALEVQTEKPANPMIQTMLLYYFVTADGAPLSNKWVSFGDLPAGRFYNQAFQGYTGAELARFFGANRQKFIKAAQQAGGLILPEAPGSATFTYLALPRVPLMLVFWEGDEDFPSTYQVLFDESVSHYLPTDACAILGSNLISRIKRAAGP
jgi:hypothetical protein